MHPALGVCRMNAITIIPALGVRRMITTLTLRARGERQMMIILMKRVDGGIRANNIWIILAGGGIKMDLNTILLIVIFVIGIIFSFRFVNNRWDWLEKPERRILKYLLIVVLSPVFGLIYIMYKGFQFLMHAFDK